MPLLITILITTSLSISLIGLIAYIVLDYRDTQIRNRRREIELLQFLKEQMPPSDAAYLSKEANCHPTPKAKQQKPS